jgi:hypothetical protein
MDGNLAAFKGLIKAKYQSTDHIHVTGFRHPCQNDGVPQALVYKDKHLSMGTIRMKKS